MVGNPARCIHDNSHFLGDAQMTDTLNELNAINGPATPSMEQIISTPESEDNTRPGADMDVDLAALSTTPRAFRRESLVMAVYPWASGVVMEQDLSKTLD